ncbi:MAG TPA: amidohydrolase family protein [Caulobacteraceae bacterium]|nr:amidohydrolase family protein [Caulobacteraceae bacterium]
MRVDAHQHFWRLARGDYGWLTADAFPTLYRDFGPQDLAPLLAAAGVERTVLVQAAPTAAETAFLLELATTTPFVAGVVGWTDFEAPRAADAIEAMAANPKLLGLRPMLQDLEDDAWICGPRVAPALDALEDTGLRFDALVKPRHLPHLARLLADRPDLRVVIDHGAKPDIAAAGLAEWSDAIRAIANDTAAVCKLSGLVTEAAPGWREADLRPYSDVLLEAFGPSRLMWGSDWPVVNRAGGYAVWRATAEALTEQCDPDERDAIFGGTAQRFYGIAE